MKSVLTRGQLEIVRAAATGKTYKAIALDGARPRSHRTIRNTMYDAFKRTRTRCITQLVAFALVNSWIVIDESEFMLRYEEEQDREHRLQPCAHIDPTSW